MSLSEKALSADRQEAGHQVEPPRHVKRERQEVTKLSLSAKTLSADRQEAGHQVEPPRHVKREKGKRSPS